MSAMQSTLQIFDTLDELSRHRALNEQESITLELAQRRLLSVRLNPTLRAELRKRGIFNPRTDKIFAFTEGDATNRFSPSCRESRRGSIES